MNNSTNNIADEVLNFIKTKSLIQENNSPNNIENNNNNNNHNNKMAVNEKGYIIEYESSNENNDLVKNITNLLKNLLANTKLETEDQQYVIQNVCVFLDNVFAKIEEHQLVEKQNIYLQIKQLMGTDFNKKINLIQRAFDWLGLNSLENKEEYVNFFNKMAKLGTSLSEDQGVKHEQNSFSLTKEEAKKQRKNLISDNNFSQALTNKSHPLHKDALSKLRNLNSIIVS